MTQKPEAAGTGAWKDVLIAWLLAHGAGAAAVCALNFLEWRTENISATILGLSGAASFIFLAWAFLLAVRSAWKRPCPVMARMFLALVMIEVGAIIAAVPVLLTWRHWAIMMSALPVDHGGYVPSQFHELDKIMYSLDWGLPVFGPFAALALVLLIPFTAWRMHRRQRPLLRNIGGFLVYLALLALLVLPIPLFVFCSMARKDIREHVYHLNRNWVAPPLAEVPGGWHARVADNMPPAVRIAAFGLCGLAENRFLQDCRAWMAVSRQLPADSYADIMAGDCGREKYVMYMYARDMGIPIPEEQVRKDLESKDDLVAGTALAHYFSINPAEAFSYVEKIAPLNLPQRNPGFTTGRFSRPDHLLILLESSDDRFPKQFRDMAVLGAAYRRRTLPLAPVLAGLARGGDAKLDYALRAFLRHASSGQIRGLWTELNKNPVVERRIEAASFIYQISDEDLRLEIRREYLNDPSIMVAYKAVARVCSAEDAALLESFQKGLPGKLETAGRQGRLDILDIFREHHLDNDVRLELGKKILGLLGDKDPVIRLRALEALQRNYYGGSPAPATVTRGDGAIHVLAGDGTEVPLAEWVKSAEFKKLATEAKIDFEE